jgi:hypothetical protein
LRHARDVWGFGRWAGGACNVLSCHHNGAAERSFTGLKLTSLQVLELPYGLGPSGLRTLIDMV